VIEDAAHATEAVCQGEKIGAIADATCFSFYVTKNLVTGEGGMLTTPHEDWAETIRMLGLHGMSKDAWKRYSAEGFKHYQVMAPGYKYNMMDLQAAIGIHQLPRLPQYLQRREAIWRQYDEAFATLPVIVPAPVRAGDVHARHLYTLLLDLDALSVDRDHIMQALYEANIGTGIHFLGLHLHPYYQQTYHYKAIDFPSATWISERTLSLPLSARLTDEDVADVIEAVSHVLTHYRR
jgi:dTDP-4-amino-4,6-dideoxygalactose transaminase